jgi:hypothetical protein
MKLDLRNAFFNIPLAPCSRFITAFQFRSDKYVFNRLPFGLSLSPFFMQRFISLLVDMLRPLVSFVWGHIDNVLIVVEPHVLRNVVQPLLRIFFASKVLVNWNKTLWHPTSSLPFLGAIWDLASDTIYMDDKRIKMARSLVTLLSSAFQSPPFQQVRRALGYLAFVWPLVSLPWSLIARRYKRPWTPSQASWIQEQFDAYAFLPLPLFSPAENQPPSVYVDASFTALGVSVRSHHTKFDLSLPTPLLSPDADILHRESLALFLGTAVASAIFPSRKVSFFTDNTNVLAAVTRNRGNRLHHQFFAVRRYLLATHSPLSYVRSCLNPADVPSRLALPCVGGDLYAI